MKGRLMIFMWGSAIGALSVIAISLIILNLESECAISASGELGANPVACGSYSAYEARGGWEEKDESGTSQEETINIEGGPARNFPVYTDGEEWTAPERIDRKSADSEAFRLLDDFAREGDESKVRDFMWDLGSAVVCLNGKKRREFNRNLMEIYKKSFGPEKRWVALGALEPEGNELEIGEFLIDILNREQVDFVNDLIIGIMADLLAERTVKECDNNKLALLNLYGEMRRRITEIAEFGTRQDGRWAAITGIGKCCEIEDELELIVGIAKDKKEKDSVRTEAMGALGMVGKRNKLFIERAFLVVEEIMCSDSETIRLRRSAIKAAKRMGCAERIRPELAARIEREWWDRLNRFKEDKDEK